ncbi:hypothetical protein D3C86_1345580 [compost metagenome]
MAKPLVVWIPTLSLFTSTSSSTLPSGVICGVTSSFRLALRNCTEVAPLDVADWYGSSVPCSISALMLLAVTTRGLEMILPLPSASSADSSSARKRPAPALKMLNATDAGFVPLIAAAGRLKAGPLSHVASWVTGLTTLVYELP